MLAVEFTVAPRLRSYCRTVAYVRSLYNPVRPVTVFTSESMRKLSAMTMAGKKAVSSDRRSAPLTSQVRANAVDE